MYKYCLIYQPINQSVIIMAFCSAVGLLSLMLFLFCIDSVVVFLCVRAFYCVYEYGSRIKAHL